MSNSPSRSRGAFLRPGFATSLHSPGNRGVGGAPRNVRVRAKHPLGVHVTRHARRLARRLASHDAGRSPLGAPPWRFFTRGRASVSGIRLSSRLGGLGSVQRAPRSQVIVPGGRGPGPPEANGYKPPPQDATPRSAFRMSPDDALNERGCESIITASICSQVNIRFVVDAVVASRRRAADQPIRRLVSINSQPLAPACSTRRPARARSIYIRRRRAETQRPRLRARRTSPCRRRREYWACG